MTASVRPDGYLVTVSMIDLLSSNRAGEGRQLGFCSDHGRGELWQFEFWVEGSRNKLFCCSCALTIQTLKALRCKTGYFLPESTAVGETGERCNELCTPETQFYRATPTPAHPAPRNSRGSVDTTVDHILKLRSQPIAMQLDPVHRVGSVVPAGCMASAVPGAR